MQLLHLEYIDLQEKGTLFVTFNNPGIRLL